MFELGKAYDFDLLDSYDEKGNAGISTYYGRTVYEIDGPLLKITDGSGYMIVNTHAPAFFRAIEVRRS
ncbi:hypothetical protein C7Y68_08570 [Paracidovorax avenae]|uniref:hypothetical protein n=1 Tax=Paracidovorax avenae TaxID=80867 RepID=UPI000D17D734|nr:hypothetical protein [Paracidovorax avenae]AVT20056.1 hypothetical protein C7Y68_08570 [Paracidovorax avenae]